MSETPMFVATPFSSVSLEPSAETYFLLPFSAVSTADGSLNVLDAPPSSDSAVQNVFINNQEMAAIPVDSVHLISTPDLVASSAVPVVHVHNFTLPLTDEAAGATNFSVPGSMCLISAPISAAATASADGDSRDCFYSPNAPEGPNESEEGVQGEESSLGAFGETLTSQLICSVCGYRAENAVASEDHQRQWNGARHYRCDICETVFDQVEKLTAHEKHCRISKPFRCECGEMFNREINYTVHLATHSLSDKELRCPLCQDTFRRVASFRCHLKLHAVDDIVTCILCQEDFASNGELRHHIRTVHATSKPPAPLNICKQCGAVFKRPLELAEHMITHKKIKETLRTNYRRKRSAKMKNSIGKYSCSVCSKTFDRKSTFDRHQLIHTGERPFVCKVCGKSFNQKGALMFHEARHLPQKPHKCQLCGAGFSQRGNLRTHVKRVHPASVADSDTMLECPLCSCWFKSSQSLQAHLKKRHNEHLSAIEDGSIGMDGVHEPGGLRSNEASSLFPMQPSIPARAPARRRIAKTAGNGSAHPDSAHSKKNRQTASEHQSATPRTASMRPAIHRVETTPGQPWQCSECEKTFSKLSDINRHLRTHTGERPFACEYCPQKFSLRTTLDKHVRSKHLRLKSARCYICWKVLSNCFTLSRHLRIHARETVDCEQCSRKFRTMSDLRRHAKKAHAGVGSAGGVGKNSNGPATDSAQVKLRQPLMETEMGVVELVEKGTAMDTRTMPVMDETGRLERPYSCVYCPLRFKKRSHLEEHTRSHQNSRPYTCRFGTCRRKFFTVSALREHALIHSGVRRHICDVCKKAFLTRRALARHRFVHSDPSIRPFICPYCGKRFKRGVLCRRHIKVHKSNSGIFESGPVQPRSGEWSEGISPTWNLQAGGQEAGVVIGHEYGNAEAIAAVERSAWDSVQQSVGTFSSGLDPNAVSTTLARPEEQQHQVPAPSAYLSTETGFPAESQAASNSFVACWDSIGQNLTPIAASALSAQAANVENVLQTPDIVGLNALSGIVEPAALAYPILHSPPMAVCDLRPETFQSGMHLDMHTRDVRHHQDSNYDLGIPQAVMQPVCQGSAHPVDFAERPVQSTVDHDLLQQWRPQDHRQKFSCPECGQTFQRAAYLSRHVYEAHPNASASAAASSFNAQARQATTREPSFMPDAVVGVRNPDGVAQGGYGASTQEEHHQAVLNMTGQIPVVQINSGEHVWGSGATNFAKAPVQARTAGEGACAVASVTGKLRYCPCCGKSFKKPSDLIRHIRIHTDERPFVCECGRGFKTKTGLVSHKQTHETNRAVMHRCQVCNKILASRGALKSHLRQHTNEKSLRCLHCAEEFRSAALLKQHTTKSHGVDPIQTAALSHQQLQNAQLASSGEPSAFSQVVPTRSGAMQSQLLDTDRLALILLYNANNELQLSVRRISGFDQAQDASIIVEVGFLRELVAQGLTLSIPLRCDGAGPETSITVDPGALLEQGMRATPQLVNSGSSLSQSSAASSRIPEPPTPSAYLTTFPSGDGDHDFGVQVAAGSTVEKGARTNEASFIVECKICDLRFSNVQESRIHFQSPEHETAMCVQSETNGPSHMCDTCGKLFATRIRLLRHMRSHTGERPFQCNICGECFTQSNSLKKHCLSKHTDVRPFACPCCDRQFTLKYNMETHVRRVHGQTGANENVVAVEAENSNQRVRTYLLSL